MGRTLPTIVQALRAEEAAWKPFRRALRREDQEAFDELWRLARRHAAPASMAGRAVLLEALLVGMLVGLARRLLDLERREGDGQAGAPPGRVAVRRLPGAGGHAPLAPGRGRSSP